MAVEYQYLGTGAAEGMPATFCACPVCLRSMREGGKSLRMRACTLLGDDVLIDLSPDIHAQKLKFGLRRCGTGEGRALPFSRGEAV